jgi:H+/Cl- antiporter ClcA
MTFGELGWGIMFLSRSVIRSGFSKVLGWLRLAVPVGLLVGSVTAFFLWSLDVVTKLHWAHPGLLWLLPMGGVAVGLLYHLVGKGSDKGHDLLMDEIHQPGGGVPVRMTPLVLIGTLVTHLLGGSSGREGTAVQMGGSLASLLARWFRLGRERQGLMLMCGIAAGFGAVFGTPLAGAIFAMEVLVIGHLQYAAVIPLLLASAVGDFTSMAWGTHHTDYAFEVEGIGAFDVILLVKAALAGLAFGLAARMYVELAHRIKHLIGQAIAYAPLRPALGGLVVIAMVYALGSRDYLGLGVDLSPGGQVSIVDSFHVGGATPWSWLWKMLFTAVTSGAGFKGGEVTPLFFIGATLGNAVASLLHEPVALFAAFGFIAVFAGAANTPLCCTVMGMELFGEEYALYFAVVCYVAFYTSGKSGIYASQRLNRTGCTLSDLRGMKARPSRL